MQRTRYRKRRKLKKAALFFLILLFAGISYLVYMAYNTYIAANDTYSELERGEISNLRDKPIEISKDPFSVLLMGVEDYTTGGANGRTDSLMLATIDPENKTMKLLSIPRDTRTYIKGKDKMDKINHAYAFGGKDETIEAVENLLEVPVDYYATVNFKAFKNVIDELGGITVDVPFDFWEGNDDSGNPYKIYFTEGEMHLDGEKALAYARMRKRDPRGDFGRADRQKQVLEAAIKEMMAPTNLLKVDNVAKSVGKNVETNLKVSYGIGLLQAFSGFNTSEIEQLHLNGADDYINGTYYFIPDDSSLEEIKQELLTHLRHTTSNY